MATYLASVLRNRHPLFFSRDTMAWFDSRLESAARTAPTADTPIVFVTSEQQPWHEGERPARNWTVRVSRFKEDSGWDVDYVGEFGDHDTLASARATMRAEVLRLKAGAQR